VYKVEAGAARKEQLWVADAQSGKSWRLLAERGEGQEQRWSPSVPPKLCLLTEAGGGGFDVATVSPDGKDLILLTDIGAQSIDVDDPRWSPTGEWVAFISDIDMTQTEQEIGRSDCWVSRPDGTEARNLTNATSPATEKQLEIDEPLWSWDGRWILAEGERFDNQGNDISTVYLIDPVNGGYDPIITSYPRKTGEMDFFESVKWSYDSTKIAVLAERYVVKNWGPEPQFESLRLVLSIYDVQEKRLEDILIYDTQLDRKGILGSSDRGDIEEITWSPDNRSILLTIATIVSMDDNIFQPDVYRLDLPPRFIAATAAQHIGPPMGRGTVVAQKAAELTEVEQTGAAKQPLLSSIQVQADQEGFVTETLRPLHMTVEEAVASLPADYSQYFTANPTRNILLFKGPTDVLSAFRNDLQLIDTPPPHILVDLLAVELSDEANQKLGLDWTYTEGHFGLFQPTGKASKNLAMWVQAKTTVLAFPVVPWIASVLCPVSDNRFTKVSVHCPVNSSFALTA